MVNRSRADASFEQIEKNDGWSYFMTLAFPKWTTQATKELREAGQSKSSDLTKYKKADWISPNLRLAY